MILGVLSFAFDVVKTVACFSFIKAISKNLNDVQSNKHYKRMHFQGSELMFRVTLKGKSGINKI